MLIRKRARLLTPLMLMIAGVALLAIAAGCTSGASAAHRGDGLRDQGHNKHGGPGCSGG